MREFQFIHPSIQSDRNRQVKYIRENKNLVGKNEKWRDTKITTTQSFQKAHRESIEIYKYIYPDGYFYS